MFRGLGWLFGPVFASVVGSIILVRIYDLIVGGLAGTAVNSGRALVSVGTWTAIISGMGMHHLDSRVGKLQRARKRLDAFTKKRM